MASWKETANGKIIQGQPQGGFSSADGANRSIRTTRTPPNRFADSASVRGSNYGR